MRVGIVQPSYIPWRGYFDLIDDCDLFVFLDDVQYTQRDWRNRNRIKTHAGTPWLTVPVLHDQTTLIRCATIDYSQRWIDKHIATITQAYARAPFFREYARPLFDLLSTRAESISSLNVSLCAWLMSQLGIRTPTAMASSFNAGGAKDDRLLAILSKAKATCYISGPSAKAYIVPAKFGSAGIGLEYKDYEYPEYPQLHGSFIGGVSVIDLLFNCGPASRSYLKSLRQNEKAS